MELHWFSNNGRGRKRKRKEMEGKEPAAFGVHIENEEQTAPQVYLGDLTEQGVIENV